MFIRGKSVTQRSMGRGAPRCPPQDLKKVKFSGQDISPLAAKGLRPRVTRTTNAYEVRVLYLFLKKVSVEIRS